MRLIDDCENVRVQSNRVHCRLNNLSHGLIVVYIS